MRSSLFALLAFLAHAQAFAEGAAPAVPGGAAPAAGAAAQQPGTLGMLFPFVLMFGVIYFLMIRPQQKRMKEQQEMFKGLKQGDEVLTSSGLLGKVTGIAEKIVTLEIAEGVRIKMLKSQVNQVIKGQIKELAQ
jgi:preprotein translocase subunit YajC